MGKGSLWGPDGNVAGSLGQGELGGGRVAPDGPVSHVPLMVCGDFNDTEDSAAVAAVQGARGRLRSCWDAAMLGRQPGERFTTWKFREAGEKLAVIDYVW